MIQTYQIHRRYSWSSHNLISQTTCVISVCVRLEEIERVFDISAYIEDYRGAYGPNIHGYPKRVEWKYDRVTRTCGKDERCNAWRVCEPRVCSINDTDPGSADGPRFETPVMIEVKKVWFTIGSDVEFVENWMPVSVNFEMKKFEDEVPNWPVKRQSLESIDAPGLLYCGLEDYPTALSKKGLYTSPRTGRDRNIPGQKEDNAPSRPVGPREPLVFWILLDTQLDARI